MRKLLRSVLICFLLAAFFWCGTLASDMQRLRQNVIRLHIVANSDSQEDQENKLRVRDAVLASIEKDLQNVSSSRQAKRYLQEKLPYIQSTAKAALQALGCQDSVEVSLDREAFNTRVYDTFSLPSGIYQALRIVIGDGQGKNWWCVAFPSFCLPAASENFETVAAGAGFPEALCKSLEGSEEYELRFGILEAMGKLERFLFAG